MRQLKKQKLGIKQSVVVYEMNDKGNQLMRNEDGLHILVCGSGRFCGFIDLEDWDKVKDHRWGMGDQYLRTTIMIDGKQTWRRMHSLILTGRGTGQVTDHINRKPWDNRKENLRFCSISDNFKNSDRWDKLYFKWREEDIMAKLKQKVMDDPGMWVIPINKDL